ncbi:MAG: peroxide stress protein YaaA [Acidimicrobiales bacterium]|nr:peroxide stress protein YaaA [Acidimicrobiales bacterium]RZV42322.1 MAG: peroxide stress protein YaaA [Acidimicrobiales bacterium]
MLIVVSPAKSLDYETPLATKKYSQPVLLDESQELISVMAKKTPDEIAKQMHISDSLAELNFQRFQEWERPFTPKNARPALLAFHGDVYTGMDAPNSFTERDYTHAQKTFRILSGLYGVLRPLDLMQPYRLEMGTKLKTARGGDLYSFWGDTITDTLNEDIEASPGAHALINLASNEYFSSVQPDRINAPIISPAFLDRKGDDYKIISFFAKKARGSMSAFIIRNRVKTLKGLKDFDGMGYRYDAERSTLDRPVFIR